MKGIDVLQFLRSARAKALAQKDARLAREIGEMIARAPGRWDEDSEPKKGVIERIFGSSRQAGK